MVMKKSEEPKQKKKKITFLQSESGEKTSRAGGKKKRSWLPGFWFGGGRKGLKLFA